MTITPFLWGPERLINSRTNGDQIRPAIAVAPNGNFAVAFESDAFGFPRTTVVRLLNEAGGPIGDEFRIPGTSSLRPAITVLNDGNIVVAYSRGNTDARATILSPEGAVVVPEFVLHPSTSGDVNGTNPALTSLDSGGFAVTWQDTRSGDLDVRYMTYAANGNRQMLFDGLASTSTGDHTVSDIVQLNDGNLVIAWQRQLLNGNFAIRAKIVTETGLIVVPEFAVNSNTAGDERLPSVTVLANGNFVVAWQQSGDQQFRIFNADATPVTSDITQWSLEGHAEVKALNDGGFLMLGLTLSGDLAAQRYDAAGAAVGTQLLV
ncbi:hypothetical protein AB9K41_00085, partial [Cribrihabitans sp. XS_ASV171]